MIQKLRDLIKVLLQPGLELKRWVVLLLAGVVQIVVGVWLWLGEGIRKNPLVRLILLEGLPGPLRGTIFILVGTVLSAEAWQRVSRSLVRVMLPERPEANLGQVIREQQQRETGRRVVV